MDHTKFLLIQTLSPDRIRFLGLIALLGTLSVIAQKAVFTVERCIGAQCIAYFLAQLRMNQTQVLVGQFL